MSRFNETSIVIHDCTIVWDGMTRPDENKDGSPKYNLKLVFPPNSPDLAEFNQIAQEKLQGSKFNGVLPQGGRMPVGTAGPQEFGGMFQGYATISAKTNFMPEVRDENVAILDPMQWAALMFTGQRVNVLVDCYEYDAMGNKGIGTGLQGVQIITSAGAQRLNLGGGSSPDTAAAFGGQPGVAPTAAPPGQPAFGVPVAPVAGQPLPVPPVPYGVQPQQPGYTQPVPAPITPGYGQPAPTSGYVQPTPGQVQQAGQMAAGTAPPPVQNYVPPMQPAPATSGYAQGAAQPVQPGYQQPGQPVQQAAAPAHPQQATNFLPPVPGQ